MIKIASTISIVKIHDLYLELFSSTKLSIDIQLPKKIDRLDFGLLFSYLQFLSTWIRSERWGNLHLPVSDMKEANQYLEKNEFVYPSIVLAWEKDIVNQHGKNIKSELKNPSKIYFEKMNFFDLQGTFCSNLLF